MVSESTNEQSDYEYREQNDSAISLIFGTKQGQMVVLMGFVYTVIISLTLAIFFFAVSTLAAIVASCVYVLLTSAMIYFRAPKAQFVPIAIFVISLIPIGVAALAIAAVAVVA